MELGHWHTAAPDDDERLAICGVDRRAVRKIFEVELDDRRGHGSAELQSGCHDVYFGPPHPMQFPLLNGLDAEGSKRKDLVESDDEPVE